MKPIVCQFFVLADKDFMEMMGPYVRGKDDPPEEDNFLLRKVVLSLKNKIPYPENTILLFATVFHEIPWEDTQAKFVDHDPRNIYGINIRATSSDRVDIVRITRVDRYERS